MDWAGQSAPDNPFGNLIYSIGHRNPQGLVFSDEGRLYLSEHGPATDDEVNLVEKGANYGWPLIEGPCDDPEEAAACAELDARSACLLGRPRWRRAAWSTSTTRRVLNGKGRC